jgi:tetratricopeptide (TPR) repeat protein
MSEYFISRDDAQSDLLSCAAYLGERIKSADGRAAAMTAVVPLYLNRGSVDLAAELANTVDDPFTRERLLLQVAEKCAELGDDEYALQLADAIEDHGMRAEAFERVGLQTTARGQLAQALSLAAQMEHPDQVLAAIAIAQFVGGDAGAADETLNQIEFPTAKVHALLEMASRNKEAAGGLLERAAGESADIPHDEERIRSLIDVGNAFSDAERNDKAVETMEKARHEAEKLDNVHRDSFLAFVSLGFLHAGSVELADRALDQVNDKTQIASCLLGHAREFWKREDRDTAIEALEESYAILKSQREAETRDSKARYRLFATIAAQFAGFERGERAIEIAQNIADESEQISGLTQVAEVLTFRKEDELARNALTAIADDGSRAFALIRMSDAKEKTGDREGAVSLLDEAAALAETVPQLPMRAATYSSVASRLISLGHSEKAADSARLSLETIRTIRDESAKIEGIAGLSEVFADTSMFADDVEALLRA